MFTGIITDRGSVQEVLERGDRRLVFRCGYDTANMAIGASIACSGACLTVVEKGEGWFAADVSAETLGKTTLGRWRAGTPVNFERALALGDELGGHLVTGHVDGVGEVVDRRPDGDSLRLTVKAEQDLMRAIAPKGSVALDGVSLTVNEVVDEAGGTGRFGVNIIPHTAAVTTLGTLSPGAPVNLEIDLLARYVQRLLQRGS